MIESSLFNNLQYVNPFDFFLNGAPAPGKPLLLLASLHSRSKRKVKKIVYGAA